jgi:hypothetical protein
VIRSYCLCHRSTVRCCCVRSWHWRCCLLIAFLSLFSSLSQLSSSHVCPFLLSSFFFLLSSFLLSESNEPPSPINILFFLLPRFPGWQLVLSRLTALSTGRRPGPRGISACFRAGRNCCASFLSLAYRRQRRFRGQGRAESAFCSLLIVVTQAQFNSTQYRLTSSRGSGLGPQCSAHVMWPDQSHRVRSYENYV